MFLNTNNKVSETEMKETIQFKIATKRIKYLGINLTNEVKDLYTENYTTPMKEIKEGTDIFPSGKILHVLGLVKLILLKYP